MGEGGGHSGHPGHGIPSGGGSLDWDDSRHQYDDLPYGTWGSPVARPVLPARSARERWRLGALFSGWQDALFWVWIAFLCIAAVAVPVLLYIWLCHEVGMWAVLIFGVLAFSLLLAGVARSG